MQSDTQIYSKPTSPNGGERLMSSLEVFLVNRSAKPENDEEPMTNATCGRQCLEQFERSNPDGLWAKTFSALLIGTTDWYSNRSVLTWKLKATKSNRLYFQLVASEPRTGDTERGLLLTPSVTCIARRSAEGMERRREYRQSIGRKSVPPGNLAEQITAMMRGYSMKDMSVLLPTPTQTNATQGVNSKNNAGKPLLPMAAMSMSQMLPTPTAQDFKRRGPNSQQQGLPEFIHGLLPTPTTQEVEHPNAVISATGRRLAANGNSHSLGLADLAIRHILPTPKNSDYNSKQTQDLTDTMENQTGKTFQLNPLFVEEMMGFPAYWILMPFLQESIVQCEQKHSTDGDKRR